MDTTADRWRAVESLFHAALEHPAAARPQFVRAQADGDDALAREVMALLSALDADDGELDDIERDIDRLWATDHTPVPPQRIADFTVGAVLGAGGMGTVYEATQAHPARKVALKLLSSFVAGSEAKRRFEFEADLLARLGHPGIAHVYASGIAHEDGRELPWFAMELVRDGLAITHFCDQHDLGVAKRLRLFAEVCDATDHGHRSGVLHCDLKPSNILVDADGRVKIIDFGVAHLADPTESVAGFVPSSIGGTPVYMSPEQADGRRRDLDARTDVFALGQVLQRLLRTPSAVPQARAQTVAVAEGSSPPPSRAVELGEELAAIIGRATAQRREDRYASAAELAQDVRRYLGGYPVLAMPTTRGYVLAKLVRRNPGMTAAVAAIVVALLAGITGTTIGLARARRQQANAQVRQREAEQQRARAELARDEAIWVREFLASTLEHADPWSDAADAPLHRILDGAAAELDAHPPDDPLLEASTRRLLARLHHRAGQAARAHGQLKRGLALLESVQTASVAERIEPRLQQVDVLVSLDRAPEALEVAQRAEALAQDLPPGDVLRIRARSTLAQALRAVGRGEEARDAYVALLEPLDADPHADADLVAGLRESLGATYSSLGAFDPAVVEVSAAFEHWRALGGAGHPKAVRAQATLAAVTWEAGDAEAAREGYEQALQALAARLGDDHPATLRTAANYAVLLRRMSALDEAERMSRRAYEGRRRALGPGHIDTIGSAGSLVAVLTVRGNDDEALALAAEVTTLARTRPDRGGRNAVHLLSNYGRILRDTGRAREAIPLVSEALDIARKSYPESHWFPWAVQANYASLLSDAGDARAEALLIEASERLRALRGDDDHWTERSAAMLARHRGRPPSG